MLHAELAVIRLGQQSGGAVALQKLLASGNCGDKQDWLGHGVTPAISIIFRCHSDYVYTHTTGGPLCIQKSCTILECRMLAE